MIYLYSLGIISLIGLLGLMLVIRTWFPEHEKLINRRIIPFVLMGLFLVRFICYHCPQLDNPTEWSFYKGPMNGFLNTIGQSDIWCEITAVLLLLLRPFFGFKTAKWYVKFISLPVLSICLISLYPMFVTMQ